MIDHEDFLQDVIDARDNQLAIPATVRSEVITSVTTKELAKLLMDFSFSGGSIDLDAASNIFTCDIGYANAIFFANAKWNAETPSEYFGIIATVPSQFNKDFIALFNQNTLIGRLYNADDTNSSIYRLDVHLAGGVTCKNIFYVVKTFIDSYNKLFFEVTNNGRVDS
ncbi:hypothetical protein [Shewanella aestuarii]|uniref:YbjN domain-containing protein n=1 Tax=Shewanella aestuarii TaxID=1028752 RepID=A0A6G9QNZ9_9GAMM|nr:hypothetical protein [Shewanella aestuarii]QIR16314.1 hypothetical protein HBH39_17665 [Shewanella aestuarii]